MIGTVIGNYTIASLLGRGGMGEVFLGHTKIGTRVAIKMLEASVSSDEQHVQRFFNEALATAKIAHSGICKIHDNGFHAGRAYLVLEYLDGESLAARIKRLSRLSAPQIGVIGKQIASVLAATHRAGIVHRDLKPENIFIIPDEDQPSGERVKVLDFGIAKLTGTLAGASPKTSGTMGTPAYMAPEQWTDSSTIDARVDIYSLGCVVFEMLCGRPPFVVATIGEACSRHLTVVPPTARSLYADVPAPLDALLVRMLAKAPTDRPALSEIRTTFEALSSMPDPMGATITSVEPGSTSPTSRPDPQPAEDRPTERPTSDTPPTLALPPEAPAPMPIVPSVVSVDPPKPSKPSWLRKSGQHATVATDDGLRPAYRVLDTTLGGSAGATAAAASKTPMIVGIAALAVIVSGAIVYAVTRTPAGEPVKPDARVVAQADAQVVVTPPPPPTPPADAATVRDDIIAISRFGYFSITADAKTTIFIDGKNIGETPLTRLPLMPGPHKVKAVGPHGKTRLFDITVYGGRDTEADTIRW